jgi:predicted 2-oxoglutarate/Fe(II)-dependent dioxygenase YbiX
MDNSFISVTRDESYQLLKYNVGEHFKPHIDCIMGRSGAEGSRAISAVGYLNDDYEGGELYFPRQDIVVKPTKGSIVLFPSNFTHIHESRDVMRGTKYSVVTWFS